MKWEIMKDVFDILLKLAGLAGIIGFIWKLREERKTFLLIKVEAKKIGDEHTIYTQVQNVNKINEKTITNAFLIICPENYDLLTAGDEIANHLKIKQELGRTNDFISLYSEEYKCHNINPELIFIPLPFYYLENIDIGDEQLTYTAYLDRKKLKQGTYSVRFYLYGDEQFLHRSTQDLLIIT